MISLSVVCRIVRSVVSAARKGQRLPSASILLACHLILHLACFCSLEGRPGNASVEKLELASVVLLSINIAVNVIGYALLIALYRHSVQTIFNRNLPSSVEESLDSFGAHLALLRPLEIIFRWVTAPFRVLPDVIVLGEVRCGTTTLCHHLSSLPGCHTPFCLWDHPELDRKETFYFVGHYLGRVSPRTYRMCFPLKITKWFHTRILNRPFFSFDGCAQYLSSPTAPYLIAEAYREAGLDPPVLVVCVRDPVDQAVSWWRYENNAMLWGDAMGLSSYNSNLRTPFYPPRTVSEAICYSKSTQPLHSNAEQLMTRTKLTKKVRLPCWSISWPGGQLAGIGRNGAYASHIHRYEQVFYRAFPDKCTTNYDSAAVTANEGLRFVNVIPLEHIAQVHMLKKALTSIMKQVSGRRTATAKVFEETSIASFLKAGAHRNSSSPNNTAFPQPTENERQELASLFHGEVRRLERMTGMSFGWKSFLNVTIRQNVIDDEKKIGE